jgi:hypothetical protein
MGRLNEKQGDKFPAVRMYRAKCKVASPGVLRNTTPKTHPRGFLLRSTVSNSAQCVSGAPLLIPLER